MKTSYRYLFVTLLVIFVAGASFGQSSSTNKMKRNQLYDSPEICTQKLDSANFLFDSEPEKALKLVEEALLIAIQNNYQIEEGRAYQILGDFNFSLAEYELSLKNYEKAISILIDKPENTAKLGFSSRSSEKSAGENSSMDDLYLIFKKAGKASEMSGNYKKCLEYYFNFLQIAEQKFVQEDIINVKMAISDVYLAQGKFDESRKYYNEVLEVEKARGNKKGEVEANIRLGKLSQKEDDKDDALGYYEKSRDVALEIQDDEAVNESFDNISQILNEKKEIKQQLEVNQEAIQYNIARGNTRALARNTLDAGNIYVEADSNKKAIEHFKKGIILSDEAGDIQTKSQAVKALSEAYEKEGSEAEALEQYKAYIQLEDSINRIFTESIVRSSKKGRLLENAQNKMLVLQKDKELDEKTIELLRREKKLQEEQLRRQRLINWFLSGGILLLIITSLLVYKSNREKRKANQLLILKSLRSQMNPHFIFNALNSVNNYISNNNERAANKYLSDFSKLMRDVLENSSHDFIPLSKEIDILNLYTKLEHSRFQEKFDYKFEVDNNIDQEAFLIPPMLIQPYIENAVWHGLRYKKEKGYLHVFLKQKNDAVEITVEDNGIGRKKSQEFKTENQITLESTGLKNIIDRLKIIRDVYKIKLDVSIEDLDKSTGEGTIVKIILFKSILNPKQ